MKYFKHKETFYMAVQLSQCYLHLMSMIREMESRSSDYDDDTVLTYYETTHTKLIKINERKENSLVPLGR